jgi:hypothetical protein
MTTNAKVEVVNRVLGALEAEVRKRGGSARVSSVAGILSQMGAEAIAHVRLNGGVYETLRSAPQLFSLRSASGTSKRGRPVHFQIVTVHHAGAFEVVGPTTPPRAVAKTPTASAMKANDWECAGVNPRTGEPCVYMNFRKRKSCRVCDTVRARVEPMKTLAPKALVAAKRTGTVSSSVVKLAQRTPLPKSACWGTGAPALRALRKEPAALVPAPAPAPVHPSAEAQLDANFEALCARLELLLGGDGRQDTQSPRCSAFAAGAGRRGYSCEPDTVRTRASSVARHSVRARTSPLAALDGSIVAVTRRSDADEARRAPTQLFALWSLFDSSEAEARGAVEKAAAAAAAADVIFQPWLDPEPSQRNVAWWEE